MPTKSVKITENSTSIRKPDNAPSPSVPPHRKPLDEFLFHEGTARHAYEYLGAHEETDSEGREVIVFRVWAPHARAVSVVGSFSDWETGIPMTRATGSGIHLLTVPGDLVPDGSIYKYRITAADGLAVGRPSGFVGELIRPFLDGCYTLQDERMYALLARLADTEDLWLEPSALAGMYGPVLVETAPEFRPFAHHRATHLVWATGGGMVPETEMMADYRRGKEVLRGC